MSWSTTLGLMALIACGTPKPEEPVAPATPAAPETPGWMQPLDGNPAHHRVVIVAFEGVDPDWVERWRGELPKLDTLLGGRYLPRLQTTTPPSAPVAWTSFATGLLPGRHGIFGFVDRDLATYAPIPGVNDYLPATFGADGAVAEGVRVSTPRQGEPFWNVAARAGRRVKAMFLPYDYPPATLPNLTVLAGEGLPDLRLTTSTFFLLDSGITEAQASAGVAGGDLVRLSCSGVCTASIEGPRDAAEARAKLPITIEPKGGGEATIKIGDTTIDAREGAFSDWVTVRFPLSAKASAVAQVRLYPIELGQRVRVYVHPLAADPADPFLPVTSPAEFGVALTKTYGRFETLGWSHDTAALNSEAVAEDVFVAESKELFEQRLEMVLGELSRRDAELYIAAFTRTDRVAHMFLRLGDPSHPAYDEQLAIRYASELKDCYLDMDRALGEIHALLQPGDHLLVLSETGFQSYKREFHVNTWLHEAGYLKLAPGVALSEGEGIGPDQIDWKRTSAYAVGSGQIFLNLKGREAQGSLPPAKASAVAREIAGRLVQVRDGTHKVVTRVQLRDEVYPGADPLRAPDLVVSMADGYQTSRATSLGLVPGQVFEDNRKRWSGDHASNDPNDVPGLLVTTLTTLPEKPALVDVGPTALALLGVAVPAGLDGKSWVPVASATGGAP